MNSESGYPLASIGNLEALYCRPQCHYTGGNLPRQLDHKSANCKWPDGHFVISWEPRAQTSLFLWGGKLTIINCNCYKQMLLIPVGTNSTTHHLWLLQKLSGENWNDNLPEILLLFIHQYSINIKEPIRGPSFADPWPRPTAREIMPSVRSGWLINPITRSAAKRSVVSGVDTFVDRVMAPRQRKYRSIPWVEASEPEWATRV